MKITIGIIPFRKMKAGKVEYLLMHHKGTYWNFPKGRVDEGEEGDELKTAFREVEEETGIKKEQIKLIDGFRETYEYTFKSEFKDDYGEQVKKQAIFYLGEVDSDAKVTISHEHKGFAWCEYDEAFKKLDYEGGKGQRLLKKAHDLIFA